MQENLALFRQNAILKALLFSLLAHIIAIFALYFVNKNLHFFTPQTPKKVQLGFKRGGDSAVKNSPHKINSSIPKNLPHSTPNPPAPPQNQAISKTAESPQNPADSALNALNLSSLQLYNGANINPNLPHQKRQEMIRYIASRAIPSDIKAEIFELYGDELGDYGMAEIDFIINNLRNIGRITQYHINRRGYPQGALALNLQGKNVIEFYLHPNGDISELRVISSANSIILDNDMLTNIKIAFREYPRPTTKVKLRFYMTYSLME
ncbi:TonB family protein [Helicobacter sp. 23-1045]